MTAPTITEQPSTAAKATTKLDPRALTDSAADLLNAMAALPANHPSRAALRDRAIEAWLPLANHLAHRYSGRGEPTDDLAQTAAIGLIKAIDKFDPQRGVDFAGTRSPPSSASSSGTSGTAPGTSGCPAGSRSCGWPSPTPTARSLQTLGRSPTVADIAAHLKLTEEEVLEGLEGARAYNAVSLSTPTGDGERATELGDMLGGEDSEFELAELRVALGPALATLDEREQKILTLRFYGNLTQRRSPTRSASRRCTSRGC